jgi:EmrB/QacA subfamily drug resistance transporter
MFGRKFFYIAGLAIFILMSLMCGLSNTMTQIIAFRGIQGIGGGMMMANAFTVIADLFPPAERGKYQGFMSGIFGLSSIIGPALGGFITDTMSWHWVFFVNIPLGVLIIILFVLFFPNLRPSILKHKIDYWGAATLVLAVVPAMLALTWAGVEYPWSSLQIVGMFVFSALMTVLFVMIERRSEEPIMPLWLFKNRIVAISELVIFLTAFGMFGGIVFIPLFFQGVLGSTATVSGSFLTPMMLGMVAGSFVSGQLLSRAGGHYRLLGAIGVGIMAVGMALLSRMTVETSYTRAVVNMAVTGLGLGTTMPCFIIAVQNAVPFHVMGVATSSTAFFRSIGGTLGLAIFGSVMNNRFAAELINGLPAALKAALPPEQLASLANNPQVLVSAEAQTQLKAILEQLGPQGTVLFEQTLAVLRQALASALSQVFLLALLILIAAFIVNLFIKEIPLQKQQMLAGDLGSLDREQIRRTEAQDAGKTPRDNTR